MVLHLCCGYVDPKSGAAGRWGWLSGACPEGFTGLGVHCSGAASLGLGCQALCRSSSPQSCTPTLDTLYCCGSVPRAICGHCRALGVGLRGGVWILGGLVVSCLCLRYAMEQGTEKLEFLFKRIVSRDTPLQQLKAEVAEATGMAILLPFPVDYHTESRESSKHRDMSQCFSLARGEGPSAQGLCFFLHATWPGSV